MDIVTRGAIEHQINSVFQEQNMLEGLDWILEVDRELTSLNDFALGYFLGALMQIVVKQAEAIKNGTSLTEEEIEEIRDIIKRWVIPFREKLNREIEVRNANAKT